MSARCAVCGQQIIETSFGWWHRSTGRRYADDGHRAEPVLDEGTVADDEGIGPW